MTACSVFHVCVVLTHLQLSVVQGPQAKSWENRVLPQTNSFCVALPLDCGLPSFQQLIKKKVDQGAVSLKVTGEISGYCPSKQRGENDSSSILLLCFFPRRVTCFSICVHFSFLFTNSPEKLQFLTRVPIQQKYECSAFDQLKRGLTSCRHK